VELRKAIVYGPGVHFQALVRINKLCIGIRENPVPWSEMEENSSSSQERLKIAAKYYWEMLPISLNKPPLASGPF